MLAGLRTLLKSAIVEKQVAEKREEEIACHSRSTSAGNSRPDSPRGLVPSHADAASTSSDSENEESSDMCLALPTYTRDKAVCPLGGLPDWEYPGLLTRNTFLDVNIGRPTSLEGFFQERNTQSCPVSGIGAPPGLESEVVDPSASLAAAVSCRLSELSLSQGGLGLHAESPAEFSSTVSCLSGSGSGDSAETALLLGQEARARASVLPEFEYPALPVFTRNTFLDVLVDRPLSLEGFFQDRDVRSCPASGIDGVYSGPISGSVAPREEEEQQVRWSSMVSDDDALWCAPSPPPSAAARPAMAAPAWGETPLLLASAPLVRLAEALPQLASTPAPVLGSAELPTVGSASHHLGSCRPCAFFHTRGCGSGPACPFCHICGPEERKRRKKDKLALRRAAREPALEGMLMREVPGFSAEQEPEPRFTSLDEVSSQAAQSGGAVAALVGRSDAEVTAAEVARERPTLSLVLCLADALPGPSVPPELPTLGSVGHHLGTCQPCAFFHTRGCGSGPSCPFCHICGPEERKRRKKEKVAVRRAAKEQHDAQADTFMPLV